ncbi:MAG: hypothetical protein AB8B80_17315 [Marinicellaceae bacterium]
MNKVYKCPKCSGELGESGGKYSCWNSSCNFRQYLPWIYPPNKSGELEITKELEAIIGECLNASAYGPFFIDNGAKDNPYWEYNTLLGLDNEDVQKVAGQWPDIDLSDQYISELISSCFENLIGYPHGCEKYWSDYFSVSLNQLIEFSNEWRASVYVQSN